LERFGVAERKEKRKVRNRKQENGNGVEISMMNIKECDK
jgi:hypothetical protein